MKRLRIGEKTAQVSHAGSVNSTMKTLASFGAEHGRMGANEGRRILLRHEAELLGAPPFEPRRCEEEADHHGDAGNSEDQTFHLEALLWSAIKMPASVVKAISESAGIESRPKRRHVLLRARHALGAGLEAFRNDAGIDQVVVSRHQPPEDRQGQPVAHRAAVEREETPGENDDQRKEEDPLVPAQHARGELHDVAEEETPRRGEEGDHPGREE